MPDECPKYKIQLAKGRKYRPSCGYEFKTGKIGVGPLAFAFPGVESAYKSSGKGSLSSYVLLLVTGLSVGIVMGGLLYPLHTAISSLLWEVFLKEEDPFVPLPLKIPGLLLVLGYFLVGPFLLGLLVVGLPIRFAVDKVAVIGKNRNVKAVKTIGLVSGLMGFVACWAIKNTFDLKVDIYIVTPGDFTPILVLVEFFLGIMAACLFLAGEGVENYKTKMRIRSWDAVVSELGYGYLELKEQLGRDAITLEEYEDKKKVLEGLIELNEQLSRGAINLMQYEQKKKKLLEKYQAR